MGEGPAARLRAALTHESLRERFDLAAAPFLERRGQDPALRELDGWAVRGLAHVLASQPEAARYLSLRPHLLERLVSAQPGALDQRAAELEELAAGDAPLFVEAPGDDLETFLDQLRLLRRDETVLAACIDLGREVRFEEVSRFLSILAECCVRRALREAGRRSPTPEPPDLAVLGMGKVAGRELTYHSDLDLVFLYPDGEASVPAQVAQRLIGYLSTMTPAGVAYAVDSRLRPSGRQGALVSSFSSFERYQLEQAAVWEHLALMRARAVAGARGRAQDLLGTIRHRLLSEPSPAWPEIDAMRRRVEGERGARRGDAFKTGAGGLMDVDFLAAGSLLECGASDALPSIAEMLHTHVRGAGVDSLLEDYAFLRRVEARTRWVTGRAVETVDLEGPQAPVIAELVRPGLHAAALAEELAQVRARVRAAYERVIAAGTIAALENPPARGRDLPGVPQRMG